MGPGRRRRRPGRGPVRCSPGRYRRHRSRRRGTAPPSALREHHGRGRGVAAPLPAGVRAHLDVRDAFPPDQARLEAALRGGPGRPARPGAGRRRRRWDGDRSRGPWQLRQRRRRRPRRRDHLPLRPPRPHPPRHRPGGGRDHRAGPRRGGLNRGLHRQPPPPRDTHQRDRSRPRTVHGPARRPPERAGAAPTPNRAAPPGRAPLGRRRWQGGSGSTCPPPAPHAWRP